MRNKYIAILLLLSLSSIIANCKANCTINSNFEFFKSSLFSNWLSVNKEKVIFHLSDYLNRGSSQTAIITSFLLLTSENVSQNTNLEFVNKSSKKLNYIKDSANFILKTSPFVIFGGDYITSSLGAGLSFEKSISNHVSVNFGLYYIFNDNIFNEKDKFLIAVDKLNGIQSEIEIRRYFNEDIDKKQGIYMSGCLKLLYTKAILKLSQEVVERYAISPYINIGYEGKLNKTNFIYDFTLGIGPKYVTSKLISNDLDASITEHGVADRWKDYSKGSILFTSFNIGFNIGYVINY